MNLIKALTLSALGHVLLFSAVGAISLSGNTISPEGDVLFIELKDRQVYSEQGGAGKNKHSHVPELQIKETVSDTPYQGKETPARLADAECELKNVKTHSALDDGDFSLPSLGGDVETSLLSDVGHIAARSYESELGYIRDAIQKAVIYPPLARLRKLEGTVMAGFYIDEGGMPQNVRVLKGSGYSVLDDEVVKIIKRASPYPPLNAAVEVPISFRLLEAP